MRYADKEKKIHIHFMQQDDVYMAIKFYYSNLHKRKRKEKLG